MVIVGQLWMERWLRSAIWIKLCGLQKWFKATCQTICKMVQSFSSERL